MKLNRRFSFLSLAGWSFVFLSFQIANSSPASAFIKEPPGRNVAIQQEKARADLERPAINLYHEAVKKYKNKSYWKSAVDLIVILDFYPEFSKLDGVIYLLGNCLYEMGIYDGADRMYRYLLRAIPKTPLLADAILGLQKVFYQKRDYLKSLRFYKALEAHYSNFDGISESRYYAGQAHFHLKNYNLAPQIFKHIDSHSEFYPFGLYTSGLVYLKKKA